MTVRIETAKAEHAKLIAKQLRTISPEQVELLGLDSVKIIEEAIGQAMFAWTGFYKDDIACIVGLRTATMLSDEAHLWACTTPVVDEHPFLFARYSQMFLKYLLSKHYSVICGCVDPQFERSVVWLKWLGFRIVPVHGTHSYCRFEMKRAA